jgi:putative restriction endonuclease
MATRTGWTRQQTLVALYLYCQIPFGKMHARNPEIIRYAEVISRTPSALAMKLTNIASLDPAIRSSGRSGLENVSTTDKDMWDEMQADWEGFAVEARQTVASLGIVANLEPTVDELGISEEVMDFTGASKTAQVRIRVGQALFRRAVLSAYDNQCCITGLAEPTLLVASHIVPWRADAKNRLNPRNGLCLSVLHDRAFDVGMITIAENMTVKVSSRRSDRTRFFETAISVYDGQPIVLPEKFRPDAGFLGYHRQHVFQR